MDKYILFYITKICFSLRSCGTPTPTVIVKLVLPWLSFLLDGLTDLLYILQTRSLFNICDVLSKDHKKNHSLHSLLFNRPNN